MRATILAVLAIASSGCTTFIRSAVKGQLDDSLAVVNSPGTEFKAIDGSLVTYRWHGYRTALVTTPDGVILFDPINAEAASEMKAWIAKNAPNPKVKVIIYSHNHADHVTGAEVFAADQPRIIAQANATADIKARPYEGIVVPTESFEEKTEVSLGGETVVLRHLPKGHTNDLIVAELPRHRAVVSVDLAMVNMMPPVGAPYSSVHGALEGLDAVLALDFDTYITGHNDYGTKQDVAAYRQLIVDMSDALKAQAAQRGVKDFHDGSFFNKGMVADVMFAAQDQLEPKYGKWRGFNEFALQDFSWVLFYGIYMDE